MKKSLITKLFMMILVSFIVFIAGLVFSLSIYFSYFYEQMKIQNTLDAFNKFAQEYTSSEWDTAELTRQMKQFSTAQNASLSMVKNNSISSDGRIHDIEMKDIVLITTVDQKGNYVDFFLSKRVYEQLDFKVGQTMDLKGYYGNEDIIIPIQINENIIEGRRVGGNTPLFEGNVQITEIKENLALPTSEEHADQDYSVIKIGQSDGIQYKISTIPYTSGLKQVIYTKDITSSNGETRTFQVISSLQPINETLEVLKRFYPILFVLALILSVAIAYLYYLSMIKPIRSITKVADDMAKMDFSKKLVEKREDELGELSSSLNTLSTNLEQALGDLTIANKKLKEDYEKELKQEQIRKEFIANASHELKTPLGIIKGYAEGIKDGVNENERDDYIDVINDEIRIMDGLIREMLRISRYDSMDIHIVKNKVDIQLMIFDTIQGFEKQMRKNGLLLDIKGEFGTHNIDEEKISSAFLNLFSNAVKYANPYTTIIIEGLQVGEHHRIEISNRCCPFTEEELQRVWERFYKRDQSHNTDIEGTGLGLAIVKSIFEAHELPFGVRNNKEGVTFWFQI